MDYGHSAISASQRLAEKAHDNMMETIRHNEAMSLERQNDNL